MGPFAQKNLKYTMTALWKWKLFFTLLLISIGLGFIYFSPFCDSYLSLADSFVFTKVHKATQFSPYLQTFLILASHELSHFVFFSIAFLIWFLSIKNNPKHLIVHKTSEAIFSMIVIGVSLYLINHLFFHDWLNFSRLPPKYTNPISNMFMQVSSWIHKKKTIDLVYPSYYATCITQYVMISMICLGFRKGMMNLLIGLYFLLPLIFMGQYGVSDILIGTASISFFTVAIGFYTPVYYLCVQWIEKVFFKISKLNPKKDLQK